MTLLEVNESGALCIEGRGFYFIAQDGDGGADIMFSDNDGSELSLGTFDDAESAEEAYERLVQEATSAANVVALLNMEMGHA